MRIVLFSKEAQLGGISHHVPPEKFLMSVSAEETQAFCKVDELTYLLIDIDDAEGDGHKLNSLMASFPHVKRIIFSGHYSPKDFKKHQFSEESADGYLKKPIETSDFLDLIRDFSYFSGTFPTLSWYFSYIVVLFLPSPGTFPTLWYFSNYTVDFSYISCFFLP